MVYVAQLNDDNICFTIKRINAMIEDEKHVLLDKYYDYVDYKYENGQWSEEKYITSDSEKLEMAEQKLTRLEQQMQLDSLINFEVMATIYEELLELRALLAERG